MNRSPNPARFVILALALGTLVSYWPMLHNGFINMDDDLYLYDNSHIQHGVTASELSWAFTTAHAGNWHPVTWLSHMVDYQICGLRPGEHHFINLLFHLANSLLIFFLLRQMTGALWRSAFVAALFAWHPLHVESVAWASERKDVLSTCFWLLAMITYVRYVRAAAPSSPPLSPTAPRDNGSDKVDDKPPASSIRHLASPHLASRSLYYALTLFLFALGLLSKPMVVTLPCVLLLIDFWPLGRLASAGIWRLLREKIPFFVLTAAASAATWLVQKGAESTLEELSLSARLGNAVMAYLGYLSKTFWPARLAALYPLATHQALGWVSLTAVALLGVSLWFAFRAKRHPYLIVGWLWFIGTLVPTIGLVQVGAQSLADRYMYIPSIGLFLLIVWGLASVAGHSRMEQATTADGRSPAQFSVPHGAFAVTGSLALILCLLLTRAQLAYWHDSASLFRHAAEVTTDNSIAYDHLGKALMDQGDLEESAKWFGQALALTPDDAEAHYKVATVRLLQGRLDEAIAEFSAALRRHPDYAEAHRNIGVALMRQGKLREGITHFSEVLRINPSPDAHFNLGVAHLQLNEPKEAAGCFVESLRLEPNAPKTQYHLALALAAQKDRSQEAIAAAEKARDLARAAGQPELAAKAQALLNQPPPENPKSE